MVAGVANATFLTIELPVNRVSFLVEHNQDNLLTDECGYKNGQQHGTQAELIFLLYSKDNIQRKKTEP